MNLGSRFHISKRASIPWYLAWAIRLGAIILAAGLAVYGVLAVRERHLAA